MRLPERYAFALSVFYSVFLRKTPDFKAIPQESDRNARVFAICP